MQDNELQNCNETELVAIAKRQGLGNLRRGIPRETLLRIVTGEEDPDPSHYAGTQATRAALQEFIKGNWGVVRSQLPGCDGCCTTFPCSDGRHAACYAPNKEKLIAKARAPR